MAAVRVQSVSNQSPTTTSIPVTSTQGWAAPTVGNLLVAWYGGDNTVTTPTGWTAGPSVVDNDAVYFWWKIAASGDSAGVTFTQSGSTPGTAGLVEYSGVLSASPAETAGASATTNTAASGGSSIGAISQAGTGTSGDLFVALANAHNWSSTTPPTAPTWTNSFVNFASVSSISGTTTGNASISFVADFQNTAAATPSTACSWSTTTVSNRSGLVIAFKLTTGAAPAAIPMLSSYVGPG